MSRLWIIALFCLLLANAACRETVVVVATPTPEPTTVPVPTAAPTPAPITTPDPTSTSTQTPIPTPPPVPTSTATPTPTPVPTPTPSLGDTIQRLKASVVRIETSFGYGSGVIFEVDGEIAYIATNHHVIEEANDITVTVRDSSTYSATLLGVDSVRDLAVLTICCDTFEAVPFADAAAPPSGTEVVIIGYAQGLQGEATVSSGIVSAVRYDTDTDVHLIQTDAAINPGNSGGPMFSMAGEVLGIVTFGYEYSIDGRPLEGLNFALSSATVQLHIPALRAGVSNRPDEPVKPTLVFSDLDWVSALIQNSIARAILEWGYGYETDSVFGGTFPLAEALQRGDTNITMEIWLPNQQEFYDAAVASGTVTSVGKSLEDNWQSAFIIPQYVADAHPGLQTPQDLKKPEYKRLFAGPGSGGKARLLNCIPSWECEGINRQKITAYGLQDHVQLINPGSDVALAGQIRAAFERQEPVLFYYWGPTVLSHALRTEFGGFKILEEPPYSDVCFATDFRCDYPTAEVHIVVRSELLQSTPDVIEFLKKWDFHAGNQLAAENYLNVSGADYSDVASWFLRNTTDWHSWVTTEARDKVIEALSGLPSIPTPTPTPTPVRSQDFGPLSGEMVHLEPTSNQRPFKAAGVSIQNLVAEATFANPYDCSAHSWAHGLLFRISESAASNPLVAIGVSCNGYWSVDIGSGDNQQRRHEGQAAGIATGTGEQNHLRVVAVEDKGWFFLNGELVATLDLEGAVHAGDIAVTTGHFIGSQSSGSTTQYLGFRASELSWLYGPASDELTPTRDDLAVHNSSQYSRDLVIEASFTNPQRDYDAGFYIRDNYPDSDELIGIDNYGNWFHLTKRANNENYTEVTSGTTRVSSANHLLIVAIGDAGWFFVNGEFVTRLSLAHNQRGGWVGLFAGYYLGNEATVEFNDFNIWAPADGEH